MTAPSASAIDRVLETCLYAENLDDTAAFYETVLGLRPFSKVAGRHVFFRTGPAVFLLFNPTRTAVPGGDVPPHGARGPGHVAFAVKSEDLPGWQDVLRQRHVQIEAEMDWPGGGRSIYFRDPAGNSVELATPAIWSISEDEMSGRPPVSA